MSQTDTAGGAGSLGDKKLSTLHAVAQSLAIGPMFSVALILGGISRPDIGAGWNAALAVVVATLGVLAIGYVVALYARRFAGAGAVYEYLTHGAHPWLGVLTAGFFFMGVLFLGGGGIYLGLGILADQFWTTHISDIRPGLVALGARRTRDRARPELRRHPDRRRRDADLRGGLVRSDADPRGRDHREGREGRHHVLDVRPGADVVVRCRGRWRPRRRAPRHPPLRRLRGGRVHRRGIRGPASLDPARGAVHDRGRRHHSSSSWRSPSRSATGSRPCRRGVGLLACTGQRDGHRSTSASGTRRSSSS